MLIWGRGCPFPSNHSGNDLWILDSSGGTQAPSVPAGSPPDNGSGLLRAPIAPPAPPWSLPLPARPPHFSSLISPQVSSKQLKSRRWWGGAAGWARSPVKLGVGRGGGVSWAPTFCCGARG